MTRSALLAAAAVAMLAAFSTSAQADGLRVVTTGYYPSLYSGPAIQTVGYRHEGVGYGVWGVGYGSTNFPNWYPYANSAYPATAYSNLYSSRFYRHYPIAAPIYTSAYYGPSNYSVNYAPFVYSNYANVQISPAYTAYPAYSAFYGSYGYNSMGCNCW